MKIGTKQYKTMTYRGVTITQLKTGGKWYAFSQHLVVSSSIDAITDILDDMLALNREYFLEGYELEQAIATYLADINPTALL